MNDQVPAGSEQVFRYRTHLTRSMYLIFAGLFLLTLVEIYFSGITFDLTYRLLRGPLEFLRPLYATGQELVGEGTIAAILVVIWIFSRQHRQTIVPYLIALLIASTVVTAIKLTTGRARPPYGWRQEDRQREEINRYLEKTPEALIRPERGDYWLWFTQGRPGLEFLEWFTGDRPWWDRNRELSTGDFSSFPSGHSASAFLLAVYLSHILPKGRYLWYLLAVGTACARIFNRRHYPGDTLFGGAIGWFTFYWVFSMTWPHVWGFRISRWVEGKLVRLNIEEPPGKPPEAKRLPME